MGSHRVGHNSSDLAAAAAAAAAAVTLFLSRLLDRINNEEAIEMS